MGVSCEPAVVWFAGCELGFILLVVSLIVEPGCEPVQILWILVVWRMHFSVLYRYGDHFCFPFLDFFLIKIMKFMRN